VIRGERNEVDARDLRSIRHVIARLCGEDEGQDLIEYALLTATFGMAALAGWNAMGGAISNAYASWDTAVQRLWEPQEPGS
jgi:Flp pilus assembly pilin Flp